MSQFGRLFNGLPGNVFGHAIRTIVGDGIVEQGYLLGYQGDIFSKLGKLKFVDISVIQRNVPVLWQIEPGE